MRASRSIPGLLLIGSLCVAARPVAADVGGTSLTDPQVKYTEPADHTVTLRRGPVIAVIVDNEGFGEHHRAGYNGIASLTHDKRPENVFVPLYAGLNLEHYYDGSNVAGERVFEPRSAPMHLRVIDEHAVELYQPPTPTWKVESCTRFTIEDDATVRMRFECIPRVKVFKHGYIGVFWASYIDRPESKEIYFLGREKGGAGERWIDASTPAHGVDAGHVPADDTRVFKKDDDFPPGMLMFSRSKYEYTQPFYYGVSHGMALVYMFRPQDRIIFTQSPTGGGPTNPAWDFQWFIEDYEVGKAYSFEMCLAYVPFESPEQIKALYERRLTQWKEEER